MGPRVEEGGQSGPGTFRNAGQQRRKSAYVGPIDPAELIFRDRASVVEILDANRASLKHTGTCGLSRLHQWETVVNDRFTSRPVGNGVLRLRHSPLLPCRRRGNRPTIRASLASLSVVILPVGMHGRFTGRTHWRSVLAHHFKILGSAEGYIRFPFLGAGYGLIEPSFNSGRDRFEHVHSESF